METYTFLRELADSWVLLAMTLFFIGMIGWLFRPGARAMQAEAASIPFRDAPLQNEAACKGGCPDCGKCTSLTEELKP